MKKAIIIATLFFSANALGCIDERSSAHRLDFVKSHPCPVDGKTTGVCHGYVVDHIRPLCAGGADDPSNMQWQTAAESYAKDVKERALCAKLKGNWMELVK